VRGDALFVHIVSARYQHSCDHGMRDRVVSESSAEVVSILVGKRIEQVANAAASSRYGFGPYVVQQSDSY
jgi:hypothetical protein